MGSSILKNSRYAVGCLLMAVVATVAVGQDISSNPSSWAFANTYVGKASGNKVFTITNLTTSGQIIIETVGFDCPDFGLASGVAPFTLGQTQTITHYSVFFQPQAAQTYNCNFILSLNDGTSLYVPVSGLGLSTSGTASLSTTAMSFANQSVGTTSPAQTVTITNNGSSTVKLEAIQPSSPSFTTSSVTLPYSILSHGSLTLSVFYTPSLVGSETGALDLDYDSIPDNGVTLNGNGIVPTTLTVATNPTLPQATQNAAYQATLATSGGTGPYTWALASGSTLPSGLSLSSAGVITGTVASSVSVGNYTFTVQVTDSSTNTTASSLLTLGVYGNLGDNCNDISFDVPNTSTPMVAITDLGTGTYQGYEAGLYPNGSNVRPAGHDADGVAFANAIQPLDSNGNPSPTGKYVFLGMGESTAQNEFARFVPIANADPAKNPNLVIVDGGQGGATPNTLTSTTSAYWLTLVNNYLPQSGVTANQVVALWLEDTDGIATGSFPTDVLTLQTEYETAMQTMLILFPNLKLVYFSSRVYGGYSNGVGTPANPEPYSYEVGYAVKWAIGDQINGNANLNYNPSLGAVVAPWMSWGPYYWSNGMLGRNDGLVWDCEDFSPDGTHPSIFFGQVKVASKLLQFLKTDDTTTPWYLMANLALSSTAGNNQTGNVGSTLPTALTVLATNLSTGNPSSGVTVNFSDGGAGGTFGTPSAITGTNGMASSTYTLPASAKTVTVTATSTGYTATTFTETAAVQALTATAGNNQSGNTGTTLPVALTVTASSNGTPVAGISVTFNDGGAGGSFGTPTVTTGSNGTASSTYTLPATAKTVTITASGSGYTPATFSETAVVANILTATGGNNQSGALGTTLPTALTVSATTSGNPVQGATVTFSDGGAGGSFGTPVGVTGTNGTVSTTYTLPPAAKTVTITASSPTYSSATFTETSTQVVTSVTTVSGGKQVATVGTTLPLPIVVKAKNSSGKAVVGAPITFSDGGLGGTFSPNPAFTVTTGNASTTYTLPKVAKTLTVTAANGNASVRITEQSLAGPASLLSIVSGNNQSALPHKLLPKKLIVSVTDQYGNAISGVTVTFTDNGAGGSFSTTTPVTATNGQASTSYTTGATAETVTISASTSTLGPVNFTEIVK